MKILVLGGTRFLGRHIVEAFLEAGHHVSLLTRGQAKAEFSAPVELLTGDRDDGQAGLSALAGRDWDACIDVSGYQPAQVRSSAELLKGHVRRYVFISTASVYAEQDRAPIREDDPLLPPLEEGNGPEAYGPLKVACEQIVQTTFGDAATILRPQIVAGPRDLHTALSILGRACGAWRHRPCTGRRCRLFSGHRCAGLGAVHVERR